jgi:hypothetical protein
VMGQRAREKIAGSFGYDQLATGLITIYERLLSQSRGDR